MGFGVACDDPPRATLGSVVVSGAASAPKTAVPKASASSASSAAGTTTATTSASAAPVVDEGPPVCTVSNEAVQATDVNPTTGLTTKVFKEGFAIGFAAGSPKVLVIDGAGKTRVLEVERGEKSKLPADKQTWRNLMRVSPRNISGEKAKAFIDYRDDSKDKKRHVFCGPADTADTFLEYEGTSWLDLEPKPTGEEKTKLFNWKKKGGYVELRDCRTFVTLEKDEAWAVGSVLRGEQKDDGTNEWKIVALIDFGKNDEEIVLTEVPLKGDPPKLTGGFEIPTMRRVGDKGFVVAARLGGTLWVSVLDEKRKPKGEPKIYPGWPSGPDITNTKDSVLITTGIGLGKDKKLKGLIIPRDTLALPKELIDIPVKPLESDGADAEFTAPELVTDAKGQMWLSYVEGPKDKGRLRVVPVGADLQPMGRPFSVPSGDGFVTEGRLTALTDGRLVASAIRTTAKRELVTSELSCTVQK